MLLRTQPRELGFRWVHTKKATGFWTGIDVDQARCVRTIIPWDIRRRPRIVQQVLIDSKNNSSLIFKLEYKTKFQNDNTHKGSKKITLAFPTFN